MPSSRHLTIGLISDTHGLLRPEAVKVLGGSDFIIHAGDIGDRQLDHDDAADADHVASTRPISPSPPPWGGEAG